MVRPHACVVQVADLCSLVNDSTLHRATTLEKSYPLLAPVARLLLAIPATSVDSERTFSETKLIDTRLRTSLGDELFSDLLFISKNLPDSGNRDSFILITQRLAAANDAMRGFVSELDALSDDDDDSQ